MWNRTFIVNPEYPVRNVSEIYISDMDGGKNDTFSELRTMMVLDYMENYNISLTKGIKLKPNYTKISSFKKHIPMGEGVGENGKINKKKGIIASVKFDKKVHLEFEEAKLVWFCQKKCASKNIVFLLLTETTKRSENH